MKFREAVEEAIRRWKGIWFHWNKSTQSTNAVLALEGILESTIYDDDLYAATMWLIGQSDTKFRYKGCDLERLKESSALATYLDEELRKVKTAPNLRPQRTTSTSTGSTETVKKKKEKKVVTRIQSVPSYLSALARHKSDWSGIEITDIPTETPGVYNYTDNDKQTTIMKGAAATKLSLTIKKKDIVDQPEYWAELGRLVAKHKIGRCYSCAALVVYTLVMDTTYDDLVIAVMGNIDYDHQFVLVGTMSEVQSSTGYVIDIWQSNLDRKTPQVLPLNECRYTKGNVKLACLLHPEDRASVRSFVSKK